MNFLAEWSSLEEMNVLQGLSLLMSVCVREWQYKEILNDIDDLLAKMPVRGRKKSCLVKVTTGSQEGSVQMNRTGAQPRSVPASPSPQKEGEELRAPLFSENLFRKCAGCQEDTTGAGCLSLKTSGKLEVNQRGSAQRLAG